MVTRKKNILKPKVVYNFFLLRGLIREARHWGSFTELLQSQFKNANVFFLETPGTGKQINIPSPKSITEIVVLMRPQYLAARQEAKSKTKYINIIVASSLGGMIAAEWLRIYSEDFDKAVLINTSFRGIAPFYRRLRPVSMFIFMLAFMTPSIARREKKILKLVSNNKSRHHLFLPDWIKIQEENQVKRITAINQIIAATRFRTKLQKPNLDILLLAAKKDRLADYRCSVALSKYWQVDLNLHETGGHEMAIDDPQWLLSSIFNWLRSQAK